LSVEDDEIMWRLEKVPKRLRAMTIAQRSAAQYGQYSAPTYRKMGFPELSRIIGTFGKPEEPPVAVKGLGTSPVPTLAKVLGLTEVTPCSTATGTG
jgi:hypothetical protein